MEMIIGCIFLGVILLILLIFCKNVTLNVTITYPEPRFEEINDLYNKEGDPKVEDQQQTIDNIVKTFNDYMLGGEEDEA